jgi:hypothetical protein
MKWKESQLRLAHYYGRMHNQQMEHHLSYSANAGAHLLIETGARLKIRQASENITGSDMGSIGGNRAGTDCL